MDAKGRFWDLWEAGFRKLFKVQPIRPDVEDLFYLSKTHYLGKPFEIDGVRVVRGQPVVELHVNNTLVARVLREEKNILASTVKLLQLARKSLPALAERVAHPEFADVQVLYGITFIHRGIERLGFEALPIRNRVLAPLTRWYLRQVLRAFNPDANRLLEAHPDAFVPKLVATSKKRLILMHGKPGVDAQSIKAASDDKPNRT
ncbi:MAG: polysaccharide deacetylase [Alicyclobacillus herbarius]|uniref:YkoP family protein n=1 Tax=Alicyclobacillus herbarius TaxID=122960 RepID=UPI0003FB4698|nr:hypothetical protein [Alicyclobacillus herbarius]MCL6633357.1 polysaccharide deacetylase [Alicyclobacillus herbarius]